MIGSFNKIRIYNRFILKYCINLLNLSTLLQLYENILIIRVELFKLKYTKLAVQDHDICTLLLNGSVKVCA